MSACAPADAFVAVQRELAPLGVGVKVYDAYRSYRVPRAMREPIRNPDYVADPAKGSRHNRGAAADLTLIRLDTGKELPMPMRMTTSRATTSTIFLRTYSRTARVHAR